MSVRACSVLTPRASEPDDRKVQDVDGRGGPLVIADLGVGNAGVVVDDGVDGCDTPQWPVAYSAGPVECCGTAVASLDAFDVAPSGAVGHVLDLPDIDVKHGAEVIVFVAARGLTGDVVNVGQPVGALATEPQRRIARC